MSDYAMVTPSPGGAESFARREISPAEPGPGQIRLRQTAVGLNFLDIYHRSGVYPWPVERDLIVGSEGAGVVEAVGEGVSGLRPGERVAYAIPMGAYASSRVLPAEKVVAIPDGVEDAVAATLMLKGMTVHYLIHDSHPVAEGQTALVHAAAGGIGSLMGQWLAAKGVTAIGTAGGPEKCALARANGYAHVIDYDAEDFVARVAEITDGRGVQVVYDGVGGPTWRGSLASLASRGTYVCFGQAGGPIEGFQFSDLAAKSAKATRPSVFHFIADPAELRRRAAEMFDALARGDIASVPSQQFALSDVAEAHAALEGRRTKGATVLIP